MARPIVLSNGELHVGINQFGLVHDFYYPYVGLVNHSEGKLTRHRVGVWVDGRLSWLDNPGEWTFSFRYPTTALLGHTIAKNESLQILLEIDDFVDSDINAFLRNIHIVNLSERQREVRLFMHQAFVIDDSRSNTDTAQYLPDSHAILHYRGHKAFLISGMYNDRSFDQHSIGLFGIEGHEGTYRDADDGELTNSNVEHGKVDSVIRFRMNVGPHSSERVHYWITVAPTLREALDLDKTIRHEGFHKRLHRTVKWWQKWMRPALTAASKLDPDYHDTFLRSVMIIKSHIDKRGAVIASTDSALLNYDRDTYAYCWPRDGAMVLWPLIRIGYTEEPWKFFEFCRDGMHPSGYLMHKYRADGGLGSSWHAYIHDGGVIAPPIQEDETALVVFVLAQFYETTGDVHILDEFYDSLVKPMTNWLKDYIDETTGLPRASYDLWEEVFMTTTYTTAVVFAALQAAADLADVRNDKASAVAWRSAAEDIETAAHKYLFNEERQAFYKGLRVVDGSVEHDATIDASSLFGAFMFGLFRIGSPELTAAAETFVRELQANPDTPAFPRYEYDTYHRIDPNSKGNWWFITSLWVAQYYIETDRADKAAEILAWVNRLVLQTGVMAEQINTVDSTLVSPAPLAWSHAEFIATLLDTIRHED